MKMKTILTAILVATTLTSTISTFATTPTQVVDNQVMTIEQKEQKMKDEMKKPYVLPADKYGYAFQFVDRFGNILLAKPKWGHSPKVGIGIAYSEPHDVNNLAQRTGYKDSPMKFPVRTAGEFKEHSIVLEPSEITNTVMGTVKFPKGVDTNGWYIQVLDRNYVVGVNEGGTAVNAFIKVQPDGSFKMYNVPNGDYQFQVFKLDSNYIFSSITGHALNNQHFAEEAFMWENVTINGNLNKNIDLTAQKPIQGFGPDDLFNTVDYTNKEAMTEIYPHMELSDELKALIDKEIPKTNSVSTLKAIINFKVKHFPDLTAKNNQWVSRSLFSMEDIEKVSNLDACMENSLFFTSVARYLGFQTVQLDGFSYNWATNPSPSATTSHTYIEVFADGKWVLVDPTQRFVVKDYDRNERTIKTVRNDYFYVYHKSYAPHNSINGAVDQFSVPMRLREIFDLSVFNFDTKTVITNK